MRLGRTDEAIECLKKALALKPDSVNTVWTLAFYSYIAGDTTQAARWTAELHRMGANNEAGWVEGEGAALAGDLEGAAGHFAMAEKAANKRLAITGYEFMGHLLAERGEFSAAMVELEKGIRETAPLGDTASEAQLRMDHAWLACETKDYTGCLSDVERSLQLDNSPKQLRMASMTLGTFAAQAPAGPARQMRSMLDENRKRSQTNETSPAFSMAELESAGELALVNGDCDAALKALRAESLLDSTVAARDYLGRGLRVCAAREPDATRARALRDEAAQAYAYGAFAPALLWFELKYHPPGDYAEQLGGWLSVAAPDDTRRAQAQQSLLRLRPQDAATFAHAAGATAPPAANRQRSIH
jgi:tetratricopeptide (TPR) repeat protein